MSNPRRESHEGGNDAAERTQQAPKGLIKHLYLDLEDTIIAPVMDGWPNTHLINVQKVKQFLAEYQPDYVHLFSFAVWNAAEKLGFETWTQPRLEQMFGFKFSWVPTVVDDIIPLCCKEMNVNRECLTFSDLHDFWGKQGAFRLNMRQRWKNNSTPVELLLLDDDVYNESLEWPDINIKARILNIDQMKGPEDGNDRSKDHPACSPRQRGGYGW